ncbi:MAG: preprotein translocase subunit SecE [Planctomycetota bacterium]
MAVGVYKQGQGYWVRVLTAIFAGALVLAAAAWAFAQSVSIPIPEPTSRVSMAAVRGVPPAGSTVELVDFIQGEANLVATGVVDEYTAGSNQRGELILSSLTLVQGDSDVSQADRVRIDGSLTGGEAFTAEVESVIGIDLFNPIYLQAGIAGGIMFVGAILIYLFVGVKRQPVDFLIATDGEMKKVNWSTRKEIQGSTVVIVVASFLLATGIFFVDYGFGQFFKFIGVLE